MQAIVIKVEPTSTIIVLDPELCKKYKGIDLLKLKVETILTENYDYDNFLLLYEIFLLRMMSTKENVLSCLKQEASSTL